MNPFQKWLATQFSWAFPRGSHHQLIHAAIGLDDPASLDPTSLDAAHDWLSHNDIDDATFREHRLLLAVSARFGRRLETHAAYPRLVGLQRMLWTRSMMAMREARPALGEVTDFGHEILLIKGASRLAAGSATGKERVSHDIDFVVRPGCMLPVFKILVHNGWMPSPGTSSVYIREHIASYRSINLFRGNFGDVDLHSRPLNAHHGGHAEDCRLWEESQPASLHGVPVRIPCPEDQLAISIANGGLDGHAHSDWLVDCATVLQTDSVDWERLQRIILARNISVPAAVTFAYFTQRLGYDIPQSFLQQITHSATSRLPRLCSNLIQIRPKERSGPFGQVLRAAAKKHRKLLAKRHMPADAKDRRISVRRIASSSTANESPLVESFRLDVPYECGQKKDLDVRIDLDIQPPDVRRRIEMEINTPDAHLCRVRFRKWTRGDGRLRLRVSGVIPKPSDNAEIRLVSMPSRQLRDRATESQRRRYAPLPFRVLSCRVA